MMKTKNNLGFLIFVLFLAGIASCKNNGAPAVAPPDFQIMDADSPIEGYFDRAVYEKGYISADGWAVDKENSAQAAKVMIYLDNQLLGEATSGKSRADVAAVKNNPNWTNSGWLFKKRASLSKGSHEIYALVLDKQGTAFRLPADKAIIVK
jgi:hypothetical protein